MPWSPSRKFQLEAMNRDERYLMLPRPLRLFATTLMMYVDGMGREVANARSMREMFYEFDPEVTVEEVESMLLDLEGRGWLLLYDAGPRLLVQVNPVLMKAFTSHMDGRDSKFPAPDPTVEFAQRVLWGDSGQPPAEGRGEGADDGESEGAPLWMLDPELPPPRGCPKHPTNNPRGDCGGCAGARDIHKQFMSGEITHAQAVAAWGGLP